MLQDFPESQTFDLIKTLTGKCVFALSTGDEIYCSLNEAVTFRVVPFTTAFKISFHIYVCFFFFIILTFIYILVMLWSGFRGNLFTVYSQAQEGLEFLL